MQTGTEDNFIQSVTPLFRQRKLYRIICVISFLLLGFSYDSWFFFITTPVSIFLVGRLLNIELELENRVWKRFMNKLDYVENSSLPDVRPAALGGAIGSLGDSSIEMVHAIGRYGRYNIRLLTHSVRFNTKSKNGSFSRDYRVLEIMTNQNFYHVYIDSKLNNRRLTSTAMNIASISLKDNQKLTVEGDVNKYFRIYVPANDQFKSLITLTPEKLLALRDFGTKFDVEFVENKIYLISENKIKNIQDILQYQESIFEVLEAIGVDVIRVRKDIENNLIVKTPTVVVF